MSMTKGLGRRQPSHAAFLAAAFAVVSLLVPRETQAGPPSIVFNPIVWDYGTIDAGTTASKTFVLTNLGDSATGSSLTVSLSSPWAFSKIADTCTGVSLSPKKSCTVTVQYTPTNFGTSDNATLSASGKKPAAVATATLTGMAGQPDLVLSPGS